jgi:hypothetical protein
MRHENASEFFRLENVIWNAEVPGITALTRGKCRTPYFYIPNENAFYKGMMKRIVWAL